MAVEQHDCEAALQQRGPALPQSAPPVPPLLWLNSHALLCSAWGETSVFQLQKGKCSLQWKGAYTLEPEES